MVKWLKYGCVAVVLAFFASCSEVDSKSYLPTSSGGFDEVTVVSDKYLWEEYLKVSTEETFERPYEVLSPLQAEPTLKTTFIPFNKFSGLFEKSRNLMFLVDLSQEDSKVTQMVKEVLTEENFALAKSGQLPTLQLNDVWAKPQWVLLVMGNGTQNLLDTFEKEKEGLLRHFINIETDRYRFAAFQSGKNLDAQEKLRKNHNIDMEIPGNYEMTVDLPNFVWIRREENKFQNNIIIYYEPIGKNATRFNNDGILFRDSVMHLYTVGSHSKDSYMKADSFQELGTGYETINPFTKKTIELGDEDVIETRGWWKLVNGFMGGPFVNYLVIDPKNQRRIMIDCFVYAPNEKKKPQIRRLEAIASDFKIAE